MIENNLLAGRQHLAAAAAAAASGGGGEDRLAAVAGATSSAPNAPLSDTTSDSGGEGKIISWFSSVFAK